VFTFLAIRWFTEHEDRHKTVINREKQICKRLLILIIYFVILSDILAEFIKLLNEIWTWERILEEQTASFCSSNPDMPSYGPLGAAI
jgi:hypothetical protein